MIDLKTIYRIAQLARLQVNENEAQQYATQLTKVLTHFQEISTIDTSKIEPLVTPTEITLNLRDDVARHEFTTSAADKPYNPKTNSSISSSNTCVSAGGFFDFRERIFSTRWIKGCCSVSEISLMGNFSKFSFFTSANASPFSGFSKKW